MYNPPTDNHLGNNNSSSYHSTNDHSHNGHHNYNHNHNSDNNNGNSDVAPRWIPSYTAQDETFPQDWYPEAQNNGPAVHQTDYGVPAAHSSQQSHPLIPHHPPQYQQPGQPTITNPVYQAPAPSSTPHSAKSTMSSLTSPQTGSNATPEKPPSTGSSSANAPLRVDRPGPGMVNKKKRKKSLVPSDLQDGTSSSPPAESEKEKRTKTGRACDACRTKKIRCDILQRIEGHTEGEGQPICAHCKQYDLDCTFFLPITETRFKKKRALDGSGDSHGPPLATEVLTRGATGLPEISTYAGTGPRENGSLSSKPETTGRIEGPTSIAFLLHTTIPNIPSEAYDLRHHNSWEVLEDGNGLIRVRAPPTATGTADGDLQDPTKSHNRLNKPLLSAQTMSLLVNAYFNEVAPIFPIISRQDFAAKSNPSPLLLYSICGLGATRRQFPRDVFSSVRGVINGLLRSNDVLSDARFENVQALVGDLHAQPTAATASASLVRTGAAIRMAQDIGLHRESAMRPQSAQDISYIELRRRVWAACVILDRWYGAALGIPLLVDLLDCDVLLPAPYDISAGGEPSTWPLEPSYMGLTEHLKLSILMGRVLKTIYSPTGLKYTTDTQLENLLADLTRWRDDLPEQLRFRGPLSSPVAGLLHLGHAAIQFLFWRVFMRMTHVHPPHLTFSVTIERWSSLIIWSREALLWLDKNDDALDTIFIYPYAATSCALIQYHTWARRKDPEALETLKLVKETAQRWEGIVQPDQMSIRRKTCETMTLLYDAALKTNPDSLENTRPRKLPANPTAGVTPRSEGFSNLSFIKSSEWSGGGRFVAQDLASKQQAGLPDGDVLLVPGGENAARNRGLEQDEADENVQMQMNSDTNACRQADHQRGMRDYQDPRTAHPILANPQAMRMEPASNVNPQLNFDEQGNFPQGMDSMGQTNQYGMVESESGGMGAGNEYSLDPGLLDGLPINSFDWESWSSYFDKLLPNANQTFETMQ